MKKVYILIFSLLCLEQGVGKAQSISAGYGHSLFLCGNGTAMGCGGNYYGELGDGTTVIQRNTPIPIPGLTNVKGFAAGGRHSLFLLNDGTVWACGDNTRGQLGDGTYTQQNIPVQVSGLDSIIAVEAGFYTSYFLKNDGTVWACGNNLTGQLGNGTNFGSSIPVQVSFLTGIVAMSGEEHSGSYKGHSLFLKNDGTVWACGDNNYGALGDGTTIQRNTPVQVNGLTGISAIAAGQYYSLFLKNDGTVWACGVNNRGELGNGTTSLSPISIPFQIPSLSGVIKIAAGDAHSLFLKNGGTVWVCGYNTEGELGDGTTADKLTPVNISSLNGTTAFAGGGKHSLFLKSDGSSWACGYNAAGQLGDGTIVDKNIPVQVTNLCNMITDIKKNFSDNDISIYPNPSAGVFSINYLSTEKGKLKLTIVDAKGKSVYSETVSQFNGELKKDIDLGKQAKGIYFIEIISSEGKRSSKRVVLE